MEKCGVLHFGGNDLRNGASYALAQRGENNRSDSSNRMVPSQGIYGNRKFRKSRFGTSRYRPSVSRPTARISRYLSICWVSCFLSETSHRWSWDSIGKCVCMCVCGLVLVNPAGLPVPSRRHLCSFDWLNWVGHVVTARCRQRCGSLVVSISKSLRPTANLFTFANSPDADWDFIQTRMRRNNRSTLMFSKLFRMSKITHLRPIFDRRMCIFKVFIT